MSLKNPKALKEIIREAPASNARAKRLFLFKRYIIE